MVGVELRKRKEVGAFVIDLLSVGCVGLDHLRVRQGLAEKVDSVVDGAACGGTVLVEGDVLTLGEFGERNERLERKGLVVNRALVTRHLLRESAACVKLIDSLLEDADAPIEKIVV